jgi:hypothetical protein
MKVCRRSIATTTALMMLVATTSTTTVEGFAMQRPYTPRKTRLVLEATPAQSVQVCGFKDCKSRGGGARLEKLFNEVRSQLVMP